MLMYMKIVIRQRGVDGKDLLQYVFDIIVDDRIVVVYVIVYSRI